MTIRSIACPTCGVPSLLEEMGLDDKQCQICWERYCSRTWWEMVNSLAGVAA